MTDTQRIDFIQATGASVVGGTSDALLPESFSVCVNRVTGWVTKPTLREAIDEAERIVRTTHPAIAPKLQ